jgi:ComF family protein
MIPFRDAARIAAASTVDLVFPPRCIACRAAAQVVGPRTHFCGACATSIDRERGKEACPTCAATVAQHEVRAGRCAECRNTRPKILALARVGPYHGVLGELLRQYKYSRREELLPVLGDWLISALRLSDWLPDVEALTCVPTHWRRQVRTRFYPAAELARHAAGELGLPFVPLLRRLRAGPHQVGLSYDDRLKNVVGAFDMRRGVELSGARILIIDDVRTTGATLNECAKVLRRAGAVRTYGAVVVRGKPQHAHSTLRPV